VRRVVLLGLRVLVDLLCTVARRGRNSVPNRLMSCVAAKRAKKMREKCRRFQTRMALLRVAFFGAF
jgi:hypothetical protein